MRTNIKVSICIPTYNQPELFERTLQSVLDQDFLDYEIIITDDSPNNLVELIVKKHLPHTKIKYYKNKTLKGPPDNWNEAISKASGEYIKILHHDDWFSQENSLSQFVKGLDENPESDFCFSSTYACNVDGGILRLHSITNKQAKDLQKDGTILFLGNIIGSPSVVIYRRENLEKYDPNMKWLVDIDMYIRALNKTTFIYLKEPLTFTTSISTHQVTNISENNKEIELYEYLYLYNKIHSKSQNDLLGQLQKIFYKYNIFSLNDLEYLEPNLKLTGEIKKLLKFGTVKKYMRKIHITRKALKSKGMPLIKQIIKGMGAGYFKNQVKFLLNSLQYQQEFNVFKATHGERFLIENNDKYPCINDKGTTTDFDKHYIYHTAWAARKLKEISPKFHVDISSFTYFSTLVSAFIPIRFFDYRPAKIEMDDFTCKHIDVTELSFDSNSIESLSCMHVIEHIGLGRYGDLLDVNGDLKAISELKRVVSTNGNLLFVVPIGKAKIMFNAHRIYSYKQIVSYFKGFELKEFTLIPDQSEESLIINATKEQADLQNYGCGCFWFQKKEIINGII